MANEVNYKVDKKEEIRKINQAGDVVTYYRMWVTSAKGTYFHADIAEGDLAKSAMIISARAKELDAI